MANRQQTGSSWSGQQGQSFQTEEPHEEGEGRGVLGRAGEMAGTAAEKAGSAASTVAEQARHAAANVGSGIRSLGQTIRQHGPHSGILGTATEGVAGTLESGGTFLQEKGLAGVGEEITACIRNHPLSAVFVSLGCGYLLGVLTSRR